MNIFKYLLRKEIRSSGVSSFPVKPNLHNLSLLFIDKEGSDNIK